MEIKFAGARQDPMGHAFAVFGFGLLFVPLAMAALPVSIGFLSISLGRAIAARRQVGTQERVLLAWIGAIAIMFIVGTLWLLGPTALKFVT